MQEWLLRGQLKGRWRILLCKSEGNPNESKIATLACMVLHNICINAGDTLPLKLCVTVNPSIFQKRDREDILAILMMTSSSKTHAPLINEVKKVRIAIKDGLWNELESTRKD